MGLLDFSEEEAKRENLPEWVIHLQVTRNRLWVFFDKLEQRMRELTEEAVPALQELRIEDEQGFGNMLHGVRGQLNSIRQKAEKTYEENVEDVYQAFREQIDVFDPFYRYLQTFRITCSERRNKQFDVVYQNCESELERTTYTDYEKLYQRILDEHEVIKNNFTCHQCGSHIVLDKIYFIVSHLACPTCQTKNTFQPSTLAQNLDDIGRGLAEQRTEPLLAKYKEAQRRERELYHEAHRIKLKMSQVHDPVEKEKMQKQVADLKNERDATEASIPQLFQQYQRAMFDEWKLLVPDLAEQTENFYKGLQNRRF